MSTVATIIDGVRAGGLLDPRRPALVMLSGGRDSTCLLDVAVTVLGAEQVRALHVNYGLRSSAHADERCCEELCSALGVQLDVVTPGPRPPSNLQAWARDVRYEAAGKRAGGGVVAVGHTATDQVETILYRLASSPSRRALLGMRAREGDLIRPLLDYTREQTAAYCVERDLQWCDDESNDTDAYVRNRIRRRLTPVLREIHPGAERNILALADILREETAVLDGLVDDVLGGREEIPLTTLRELPPALARLVLQRLADRAVGRPAPGTARRLEDILALRDTGTTHVDLPGGVRATATKGVLRFSAVD